MRDLSDPRPLHQRIKVVLRDHPEGLSTNELAAILGDSRSAVSSICSKQHSYGAGVEKIGPPRGQGVKWRLAAQ